MAFISVLHGLRIGGSQKLGDEIKNAGSFDIACTFLIDFICVYVIHGSL